MVVGAGLTGATTARKIASELQQRVLVIDQRSHIGGNAFDYVDENGVLVHKYGGHIFHTNSKQVERFLSKFTGWTPYEHKVNAWIDGQLVPLPINFNSLDMIFGKSEGKRMINALQEEFGEHTSVPILKMRKSSCSQIRHIADVIYEKVFLHYNLKQWGLAPEQLDPSVSARVPVRLSRDDRFFQDSFQNMPKDGYTAMFKRILDHPLINVELNTSYRQAVEEQSFRRLIYTGPIDEYFEYRYGPLPYRSLRFQFETRAQKNLVQPVAQENYPTPANEHGFTRSVEFRHLTNQNNIDSTTLSIEYPEDYVVGENEPYYPVPRLENRELFRKYQADAQKLKTVIFAGRLADYSYYNMDQAVARALSCFHKQIVPIAV
ncbi:MAG: UDP-galactopyranose mutase [Pseudomonadota bacterium]